MRHLAIVGGSDAGISAGLRASELSSEWDVTLVLADAYPNFSICGIPYYVSGDVPDWRDLAHRSVADLEATGMRLRLDTVARHIDVEQHQLLVTNQMCIRDSHTVARRKHVLEVGSHLPVDRDCSADAQLGPGRGG